MSENDCVFCEVACGETEPEVVHKEVGVLSPKDTGSKAPGARLSETAEVGRLPDAVAKRLFEVAHEVARKMGIVDSGYAFRVNDGADAGQEVLHLHAHVMGGEMMGTS